MTGRTRPTTPHRGGTAGRFDEVFVIEGLADAGFDPFERLPFRRFVLRRLRVLFCERAGAQAFAREFVDEATDFAPTNAPMQALIDVVGNGNCELLDHIRIIYVFQRSSKACRE